MGTRVEIKEKTVQGRIDEPDTSGLSPKEMAKKFMKKIPEMVANALSKGDTKVFVCLSNTDDPQKLERADHPLYQLLLEAGRNPFFEQVGSEDSFFSPDKKSFKIMIPVV